MKNIILSLSILFSAFYMKKSEASYLVSSCEQAKKQLSSIVSSTALDQVKLHVIMEMAATHRVQLNVLDPAVKFQMERILTAKFQYHSKKSTAMDKNNSYAIVYQSLQVLFALSKKVVSPADIHSMTLEILNCTVN